MIAAGVPVIPGMEEATEDAQEAEAFADQIGYPVMIKASAGGGGKGMREAASKEVFAELFAVAQQEAFSPSGMEGCMWRSFWAEHTILNFRYSEIRMGM